MRITTRMTWDWYTGDVLEDEGYDYEGPCDLCKGSAVEKQNALTSQAGSAAAQATANKLNNDILTPQFLQEMNNPVGMGQLGLNETLTANQQAISGEVGQGKEAALLRASRMGNPSSTAAIIDAVAREGTKAAGEGALNVNLENQKLKQMQQAQGIAGLEGLGSQDQGAALSYLGLSNTAANDVENQKHAALSAILNPILGLGGAVAGAAGTAIGGR